ncbi:MAG: TIGR03936 family radical SAM-associated protein [Tissierellia bacterium]|nr:TIGR03936 family radical SAM-associated protein [Tissierellia bacterium]
MHLRGKFTKEGYLRLIGHLDLMKLFHRAIKRAKIDFKYSEGFNPSPKLSIPNPLPLGIESLCEFIEFDTINDIDAKIERVKINEQLPKGIELLELSESKNYNSLSNEIQYCSYRIIIPEYIDNEKFRDSIDKIQKLDKIEVFREKRFKRGKKFRMIPIDIKPILAEIELSDDGKYLDYLCHSSLGSNLRPDVLIDAVSQIYGFIDFTDLRIIRTGQYLDINQKPVKLEG